MILILGTGLTVEKLPDSDKLQYNIFNNTQIGLALKTLAGNSRTTQIYINAAFKSLVKHDLLSKTATFEDDDDLLKQLTPEPVEIPEFLLNELEMGSTMPEADTAEVSAVSPDFTVGEFAASEFPVEGMEAEAIDEFPTDAMDELPTVDADNSSVEADIESMGELEEVTVAEVSVEEAFGAVVEDSADGMSSQGTEYVEDEALALEDDIEETASIVEDIEAPEDMEAPEDSVSDTDDIAEDVSDWEGSIDDIFSSGTSFTAETFPDTDMEVATETTEEEPEAIAEEEPEAIAEEEPEAIAEEEPEAIVNDSEETLFAEEAVVEEQETSDAEFELFTGAEGADSDSSVGNTVENVKNTVENVENTAENVENTVENVENATLFSGNENGEGIPAQETSEMPSQGVLPVSPSNSTNENIGAENGSPVAPVGLPKKQGLPPSGIRKKPLPKSRLSKPSASAALETVADLVVPDTQPSIEALQQLLMQKDAEIQELQSNISMFASVDNREEVAKLKQTITNFEVAVQAREEELKAVNIKLSSAQDQLLQKDKQLSEMNSQLETMLTPVVSSVDSAEQEGKITKLQSEIGELHEQLEVKNSEIEILRQAAQAREVEGDSTVELRIQGLQTQLETVEQENVVLKEKLDAATDHLAELAQSEKEIQETRVAYGRIQTEMGNLENLLRESTENEKRLQETIDANSADIAQWREKAEQFETLSKEHEKSVSELEAMRNALKDTSAELTTAQRQLASYSENGEVSDVAALNQIEDLKVQIDELQGKLDEVTFQRNAALSEVKDHKEEYAEKEQAYKKSIVELEDQKVALENAIEAMGKPSDLAIFDMHTINTRAVITPGFSEEELQATEGCSYKDVSIVAFGADNCFTQIATSMLQNLIGHTKAFVLDLTCDPYISGISKCPPMPVNYTELATKGIDVTKYVTMVGTTPMITTDSVNDLPFLTLNWVNLINNIKRAAKGRRILILLPKFSGFVTVYTVGKLAQLPGINTFLAFKGEPYQINQAFSALQHLATGTKIRPLVVLNAINGVAGSNVTASVKQVLSNLHKTYKILLFEEHIDYTRLGWMQ